MRGRPLRVGLSAALPSKACILDASRLLPGEQHVHAERFGILRQHDDRHLHEIGHCPNGQLCCVTVANTTGSGPSGSVCAASCINALDASVWDHYRGVACNAGPIGGGIKDCPAPASQWTGCWAIPSTPAGMGLCVSTTDVVGSTGSGGSN
jgi:hypothetical protein